MKGLLATIIILLGLNTAFSQSIKSISDDLMVNKWISATVHLEARSTDNKRREVESFDQMRRQGKISWEDYMRKSDSLSQIVQGGRGSAIYLLYNNKHYLITARHVLEDLYSVDTAKIYGRIFIVQNASRSIAQNQFVDDNARSVAVLMNLQTGPSYNHAYFFSDKSIDLALIDLDRADNFNYSLDARGYKPVKIADIDTSSNLKDGQSIMAVGFPEESKFATKNLPKARYNWESPLVALPVITRGTLINTSNPISFDGNIFVYHGFSGGPIISDDKLVGIVHGGGPIIKTALSSNLSSYYLHENIFIRTSYILPLIIKYEKRLAGGWKGQFDR